MNTAFAAETKTKAPRAVRIAEHRANMQRLGEILAARKAARLAQVAK